MAQRAHRPKGGGRCQRRRGRGDDQQTVQRRKRRKTCRQVMFCNLDHKAIFVENFLVLKLFGSAWF